MKLFNRILETGQIPQSWSAGRIVPIYKQKGDRSRPENYRGITLLSCFGKMFTSLLNKRLGEFATQNSTISENQTGFRAGYGTTDHVFLLSSIIDLYLSKKLKLFCTFRLSKGLRHCVAGWPLGKIA